MILIWKFKKILTLRYGFRSARSITCFIWCQIETQKGHAGAYFTVMLNIYHVKAIVSISTMSLLVGNIIMKTTLGLGVYKELTYLV